MTLVWRGREGVQPAAMATGTPRLHNGAVDAPDPHLALMARVARGDQGAFADLYDQLAPAVWGLVRSIVEDPVAAQQAMGDALVRVWAHARFFEPKDGPVQLWVGAIAREQSLAFTGPPIRRS